jgi:hypothetical protein
MCQWHPQMFFGVSLIYGTDLTYLNSVAFSPQANYTDPATAACWRS